MATPRPPGLVCLSLGPDDHTYAVQVSRQRTRDAAAGAGKSQPSPRRAPAVPRFALLLDGSSPRALAAHQTLAIGRVGVVQVLSNLT